MEINQIIENATSEYKKDQYAMYLRKSRADLELEAMGEGETLARHKKMLDKLAEKHDIHPDQITVYKELVSGDSIDERPEMQRLLKDVYQKKYKGVLVVEVERLARGNTKDQGEVADAFQYSNTHIISPAKVYDPNNESDQEYFEFGLFMSRREYKTIRRRLEAGKQESIEEGNFIGTFSPLGYNIQKFGKKDRRLVINEEEAKYVRMIFDWFTEDKQSLGWIARKMTELGVPRKLGASEWGRQTIRAIIKNEHYIGNVVWGKKRITKEYDSQTGKVTKSFKSVSREEISIYKGKHDPIISKEQFDRAQALLDTHPKVNTDKKLINPLANLLFCKDCGRSMELKFHYCRQHVPPRIVHSSTKLCYKKSLYHSLVMDTLVEALLNYIEDFETKMACDNNQAERAKHKLMIESMETELGKQEKRRNNLFDAFESEAYTKEEFIERKQKYNQTIEELKKQIQVAKESMPDPVDYSERISTMHQLIECLKDENITAKEKNDFLKQYIDRIEYDVIDFGRNKGGKPMLDVYLK